MITAKRETWNLFVFENLDQNPWGTKYKIAAEKFKWVQSILFKSDGQTTMLMEDTLIELIEALMPADVVTNDTEQNRNPRHEASIVTADLKKLIQ